MKKSTLPRNLLPSFFAFTLGGCLCSFPGAAMDLLLADFDWRPTHFGLAMMLQGGASILGTVVSGRRLREKRPPAGAALGAQRPERRREAQRRPPSLQRLLRETFALITAGTLLLYLLPALAPALLRNPLRALGLACLGFAFGTTSTAGNTRALRTPAPERALLFVQMGFTFGAFAAPFTFSAWTTLVSQPFGLSWRVFALAIALAAALLGLLSGALDPESAEEPPTEAAVAPPPSDLAPTRPEPATPASTAGAGGAVALIGALVFAYVSLETNLSNGVALFVLRYLALPEQAARAGSGALWGGLLFARFSNAFLLRPEARRFPLRITVGSLVACLLLALLLRGFPSGMAALAPTTSAPGTATLLSSLLLFALGTSFGAIYVLVFGSLLVFLDDGHARASVTNRLVVVGSLGNLLSPPVFGLVLDTLGIGAGIVYCAVNALLIFVGGLALTYRTLSHEGLRA